MTYEDIVRFGGDREVCAYHGEALLRHCGCRGHRGRDQRVYRHEQRGAGCQEEDHDGGGRMYLFDRGSTSVTPVLRH